MAQYMMVCKACDHRYGVSFPVADFTELMTKEKQKPCPKCGKPELYNKIFLSRVILRGTGWTDRVGKTTDEKIANAEREHDQLNEAMTKNREWTKADDDFRKKNEDAQEQAYKANGIGIE